MERTPTVITDEEDRIEESPKAELLRYHYNFGHLPFAKLQEMAKRRVIPKRVSKRHVPVCSACQYAKSTKRKWPPRTAMNWTAEKAQNPGKVVSVDQQITDTRSDSTMMGWTLQIANLRLRVHTGEM